MQADLAKLEEINLPSIGRQSLEKIMSRLPEADRARNTAGRKNTAVMNQLMTLSMAGDEPYRHLRQILAQIETKRNALESNYFRYKKNQIKLKKLQGKKDELSLIKYQELQTGIDRSKLYIEGALKEIGIFQDAYDEIRKTFRIPENWDETDSEKAEIWHHINCAFRYAFQEMMGTGVLGRGSAEYLSQFGIHPQSARKHLHDYIIQNEKLMEEGQEPTIDHYFKILDEMANKYQAAHKSVMKRMGLKQLVREDWCYRENTTV